MNNTKKTKNKNSRKFRYCMCVIETIEYSTVIESDKRLPHAKLVEIAEQRRVHGGLSMEGVRDVDIYCVRAERKEKKRERRS